MTALGSLVIVLYGQSIRDAAQERRLPHRAGDPLRDSRSQVLRTLVDEARVRRAEEEQRNAANCDRQRYRSTGRSAGDERTQRAYEQPSI